MNKFKAFFIALTLFASLLSGCNKCKICLNGGEYEKKACKCPTSYTGDLCETAINEAWLGTFTVSAYTDVTGNGCLEGVTQVKIRSHGTEPNKVDICFVGEDVGFADICYFYGLVENGNNTGQLPSQILEGSTITGDLTRTDNTIAVNFKIYEGGDLSCDVKITGVK